MTLGAFLLFLAAGRLVTWTAQTSGLLRPLWQKHPLLEELGGCDLCLGVWVYAGLVLVWQPTPFGLFPAPVEWLLLALGSALTAHLLRLGFWAKFGIEVIS